LAIEALRQAAAAELQRFVRDEGGDFPAIDWVWQALRTRGKLLGPQGAFCWGLLPPLACQAAGGDPQQALLLSVALECAIAAADALDDVQDQDANDALWRSCGLATATNTATFLLFFSQLALVRLSDRGVPDETVVELVRSFASAGAKACSGQQRDFDQGPTSDVDESQYLARITEKSASLARWACRSGAMLGTDALLAVEPLSEFGLNLGIALQIGNDLAALTSDGEDRADLRTGKRTLPIIFALDHASEPDRVELAAFLSTSDLTVLPAKRLDRAMEIVAASGALLYTAVVADVYWEHALSCLERVDRDRAGPLLDLLSRMRSSRRG
jgi:geranylgeranyl diphosphate synthase, type I